MVGRHRKVRCSTALVGWRVNNQPIERFGDLDLARQPSRGWLHLKGRIELFFFFPRRWADRVSNHFSSTWTRQVAQVQPPPHSATMLGNARCARAVSITVEPSSASTVCFCPIVFDIGDFRHAGSNDRVNRTRQSQTTPSFFCRLVEEVVY